MLNLSRINRIRSQHVVEKVTLLLIVLCSDLQSPGLSILACLITADKAPSPFHSLSKFKFVLAKAQKPVFGCRSL